MSSLSRNCPIAAQWSELFNFFFDACLHDSTQMQSMLMTLWPVTSHKAWTGRRFSKASESRNMHIIQNFEHQTSSSMHVFMI